MADIPMGPIATLAPPPAAIAPSAAPSPLTVRSAQERYKDAKPLATQITAGLGLRGFRLNLAVESAAGYEDLVALFPKIQAAAGVQVCRALELALKG
jgi:hypothetical protein